MNIVSRKLAVELGLPKYFTGKPCKHGHLSERRTQSRDCIECKSLIGKESYAKSAKVYKTKARAQYKKHREKRLLEAKAYYQKDLGYQKLKRKEWQKKNLHKCRSYNVARKLAKEKRTPPWLTLEDFAVIEGLYLKARLFSKYCGEPYEVDYFYPLRGLKVSGLHVPSNLKVISKKENNKKGNSYEP